MAIYNLQNQLLQIDTGNPRTFFYNSSLSPISIYAGLGENQVLGQRYADVVNKAAANSFVGSPAIYMLVQYLSTSAITTANLTTAAAPAPVYWTDNTFTTVTGITTEALSIAFPAGYLLLNTTDLTTLTAAQLKGAQCLIQVAGYLKGAYISATTNNGVGAWVIPVAGTLSSAEIAAGSTTTYQPFGRQMTAIANTSYADILVSCDII